MQEIRPIAKLGNHILIVNKDDLTYIGSKRALDVKCIRIDLKYGMIDPVFELENHLKFNPWEEINEEHRNAMLQNIIIRFSEREILKKIVEPLAENLVKS